MAFVYGYEFPNGKWYIGFTTQTLKKRHNLHMVDAFTRKKQRKICNAFRKYKWNRSILPVVLFKGSPEEALIKEAELADKFDAYINGYNTAAAGVLGGNGRTGAVATRRRIAEDPEMARKFVAIGKALSSSEAAKRGWLKSKERSAHPVMVVYITGEVKEFGSVVDAAKQCGLVGSPVNKKLKSTGYHRTKSGMLLGKKNDIRFMQYMVGCWAETMLPNRDPRKTAVKLCEEAIELMDALANGGTREDAKGEIGDVLFVLLDIANLMGINAAEAVESRIDSNEQRSWTIHNGYLKHVKDHHE